MRVIVDTDTASDDAVALLMALRHGGLKVEAITVVCGNVDFNQQVRNALYVVEQFAGGRVPVYPGCRRPLVMRSWSHAYDVHGRDGMGGSWFPEPSITPQEKHGAEAIVELVNSSPGEYTIIALGPLTNLAVAVRLDEELAKKTRGLYIMGGSTTLVGNITPVAEYNFWVDPDAAHVVLNSGFNPILIGWDTTLRYGGVSLEEAEAMSRLGTREAEFFSKVINQMVKHAKSKGHRSIHLADPLTMAAVLNPEVVIMVEEKLLYIDRSDTIMRGASVPFEKGQPNTRICTEADNVLFKQMLYETLKG